MAEHKAHSVAEGIAVGGHSGKAIIPGPGKDQISKRVNEGGAEVDFYKGFSKMDWKGGEKFFPKFFGTFTNEDGYYMIMEDLMAGKGEHCCVLDVKMGTRTYGPDATPDKVAHQSANDAKTTTPLLGQRLTGYKSYNRVNGTSDKTGKEITFKVNTREELLRHYKIFFDNGHGVRKDLVAQAIPWLKELKVWFETKPTARMFSSSVLFTYDGAKDGGQLGLRLIDFAHVFPITDGGKDDGYIFGIQKMIEIFEEMIGGSPQHGVPGTKTERTFIAVKPDGVQRGLVGEIIRRFEQKGFRLVALKLVQPTAEFAAKHYDDLKAKPFFPGLVKYFSSGPVVAMVWEGLNVIKSGRTLLGATNPADSAPGTIRGDFAVHVGRNICHGSDSPAGAEHEINLWWKPEEIIGWASSQDAWVYESK